MPAFIAVISSVITVPTINESTIVETIVNTGVFGLSLNSDANFAPHETTGRTNTRIVLTGNAIAKPEKNVPHVKNPFSAGRTALSAMLIISDTQMLSITSNFVSFFISISLQIICIRGTRIWE